MSLYMEHISNPVLAVDVGETVMHMLLYSPEDGEAYEFASPSPVRLLAGAVARATKAKRGVYLRAACPGESLASALRAHREAGLGLVVHPDSMEAFSASRSGLETAGVEVADQAPPDAEIVGIPGPPEQELWLGLFRGLGLERPEQALLCAPRRVSIAGGNDAPAGSPDMEELFARKGERGLRPESLFPDKASGGILRLCTIGRITNASAMDRSFAFVAGMLSLPSVAARSRREGVLLLHAGRRRLTAALVFQERLFSLLEMPLEFFTRAARAGEMPTLSQWLDDFRLGWLPPESACAQGGLVCRSEALPPEAEGFRPAFITGENAFLLAKYGQELRDGFRSGMVRCRGLLWAFEQART